MTPRIHNSFIKYMSVSCQLTLSSGTMQLCNLNKWYKVPSIEHHGGLKSHVFTLIFHFCAALNQPSPSVVGKERVRKLKVKAVICKNPRTTLPDLFYLHSPDSLPSLTSLFHAYSFHLSQCLSHSPFTIICYSL